MSARWLYGRSPSFIAADVIGVWPRRRLSREVEPAPVMIRLADDAYREKRVKYKFYETSLWHGRPAFSLFSETYNLR